MRKLQLLTMAFLILLFVVSPLHAVVQMIDSINADDVDTSFVATGGDFGLGVMSITDFANIDVEWVDNSQTSYVGGSFSLITSLEDDYSEGNLAKGLFSGGTVVVKDGSGANLLTGEIISMNVVEVFDGFGILTGAGQFVVTGGSLESQFAPAGNVYQLTFEISPAGLSDFSQAISGRSDVSLTPIPEPATICLFGIGAAMLARKKRKT